ncbi:MAG: DUF1129 domain-containing protein [candidate division KSB1 bacterium]|nr:DUF1129 domain-containing protein [candidate division KSB1 bacterium]MDZ7366912.1 DUF1129 domain-containing protein [candidate division KSB1 bacterium]MDZ7406081.1 DUF1129 domain-containing protein [candidate division KSB1 bacterium]
MSTPLSQRPLAALSCFCLLLGAATTGAQVRRQQENKPVKLAIKTDLPSYALGAKAVIEIFLHDANNKPVKAAKEYIIAIELRASFSNQFKKKMQDTIKVGGTSAKLTLVLEEIGVFNIHASHLAKSPELLPNDTVIRVRPAIRSLPRPGAWMPGIDVRFVGVGLLALPAVFKQLPSEQTSLLLKSSPQRPLLADDKDAATIHLFYYGPEGVAPTNIRVRLFNSGGRLEPQSVVTIPQGDDYAQATLTSDQIGTISVEYLGSAPINLPPQTRRKLDFQFVPPITRLEFIASPPEITLVDNADLIVRLLDEEERPIATDTSRVISFAIKHGRGEIKDDTLEIPRGRADGRTSFLPTWRGGLTLTAATPNLRIAEAALKVTLPNLLLILSAIGGVAGGAIAYWIHPHSKWWRIAIGSVTGFVLYWAFIFGVLALLPRGIVLNPLSAFALSTLGGWLGTEVFVQILKRFGLSA